MDGSLQPLCLQRLSKLQDEELQSTEDGDKRHPVSPGQPLTSSSYPPMGIFPESGQHPHSQWLRPGRDRRWLETLSGD